jgi:plasmid segregation protein ParM
MPVRIVIDAGAGNTKGIVSIDDKIVKRFTFPSAVGLQEHGQLSSFWSSNNARFEVCPNIQGTKFVVSVRPDQQIPDHKRAVPSDDYQVSPQHDSLMAAALYTSNVSRADILVIGTAVQVYQKHAKSMNKWKGVLDFGFDRSIEILKVLVLPQPYGSLLSGLNEQILERGEHVNHVVIDIGYYSTDTLTTRGMVVDRTRSFGSPFGTAAIYQHIANLLATELKMPVSDVDRIEYALRTGYRYTAHGKQFDLREGGYLQNVQGHIEKQVMEIYGRLGTTEDIASVLITGGGSNLFENAVRKVFRTTRVVLMPDPVHANARGYLLAAQAAEL